ncbi:hypothetical protein KM043_018683 [Ampulex compressa]|nr:hypothetical protein KM043_018683 [Ampulex compressa]
MDNQCPLIWPVSKMTWNRRASKAWIRRENQALPIDRQLPAESWIPRCSTSKCLRFLYNIFIRKMNCKYYAGYKRIFIFY